jgi:hypothetical protein
MTLQREHSRAGRSMFQVVFRLTVLGLLIFTLAAAGTAAPQETTNPPAQEQEITPPGGIDEYEGVVKVGLGKYFYLPAAKGFDIVVQGTIEGQDASFLTGKDIRVRGALLKEDPSVFVAESIDLKEGQQYRNVFTRTQEVTLEDHLSPRERQEFQALTISAYNKSEEWEGKGKVKVYGALTTVKMPDGAEGEAIVITDEKEKEVGKILVDSETDFARYYIKKLRLFDKFWFYINIKDTVDFRIRRRTHDLFHADLVLAGLY